MLFLFAQPVFADAAMMAPECEMVFVSGSVPSLDQAQVPVDIQPAALFTGDCDGPSMWTLELVHDGDVVASQDLEFDYGSAQSALRMDLAEQLVPDADYELHILPGQEGWGEAVVVDFQTGSQVVQGIDAPEILGVDATASGTEGFFIRAWLEVAPGADPDDASILQIEDDFGTVRSVRAESGAVLQWQGDRDTLDEICFTVSQLDGRGDPVQSEPFCAMPDLTPETDEPPGCGRGSTSMGLLLLGGLLVGTTRRRRS